MNFITYRAVYSLYPMATFKHHVNLSMRGTRPAFRALQKYRLRGWSLLLDVPPFLKQQMATAFAFDCNRHVGDALTWKMNLPLADVELDEDRNQDPSELCSFTL